MDNTNIGSLISADTELVTRKRGAIEAFEYCYDEVNKTCNAMIDQMVAVRAKYKAVSRDEPEKKNLDDTSRRVVNALGAEVKALDMELAAVAKDRKHAVDRINADPAYVQAQFNMRVLPHLQDALTGMHKQSLPIAYVPGNTRAHTELLDVIRTVRCRVTTEAAEALAHALDPLIITFIRNMKESPCTITLKYTTPIRRAEFATDRGVFSLTHAVVIVDDKRTWPGIVLGYSNYGLSVDIDEEHVKAHSHLAERKGNSRAGWYEEFIVTMYGLAFERTV